MVLVEFRCHTCGGLFETETENQWGTYEFVRCPACGSGRTTLASDDVE
jgi:DNA-directed RNA polymerase subunit RPC12/RpoP